MQKLLITLILSANLHLAACSVPGVHKIDIQQGNVITQEMVDKLKPGMEKSQVRFVLGTPPIVDPFHLERWDYVYSLQAGRKTREQRHISLYFENEKLARIQGDVTAGTGEHKEQEQVAKETTVIVPADQKKKGFFSGLKNSIGLGKEETFAKTPESAKPQPDSSTTVEKTPAVEGQDTVEPTTDTPATPEKAP